LCHAVNQNGVLSLLPVKVLEKHRIFLLLQEITMTKISTIATLGLIFFSLSGNVNAATVSGKGAIRGHGVAAGKGIFKGKGTASGKGIAVYRGSDGSIKYKKGHGTVTGKGVVIGKGVITGKGKGYGKGRAHGKGWAKP